MAQPPWPLRAGSCRGDKSATRISLYMLNLTPFCGTRAERSRLVRPSAGVSRATARRQYQGLESPRERHQSQEPRAAG